MTAVGSLLVTHSMTHFFVCASNHVWMFTSQFSQVYMQLQHYFKLYLGASSLSEMALG
jgi:hypothetical protein